MRDGLVGARRRNTTPLFNLDQYHVGKACLCTARIDFCMKSPGSILGLEMYRECQGTGCVFTRDRILTLYTGTLLHNL